MFVATIIFSLLFCAIVAAQLVQINRINQEQDDLREDFANLHLAIARLKSELTAHLIDEKVFREESAEWATEVNHFREAALKTYPRIKTNLKKEEVTDLELKAE